MFLEQEFLINFELEVIVLRVTQSVKKNKAKTRQLTTQKHDN